MQRISSNMTLGDMDWNLRSQEVRLNHLETQMGTQKRIVELRDDPLAAAESTRLESWKYRLSRFEKNSTQLQTDLRYTESSIQQAQNILQRLNELAVQGANGTYAPSDLKAMGVEVNQLLDQLVSIGNTKGPDGQPIFGGDLVDGNPWRVLKGRIPGSDGSVITQVDYVGTIGVKKTEISENTFIQSNFPGNKVFWADNQKIYSAIDSQHYTVPADTTIQIDGKSIPLRMGDSVQAVIAKINDAPVAVKASLDPVTNGLVLETTQPHQLFVEDGPGGNVLKSLGIVSDRAGVKPPLNYNQDAKIFGGSVFDAVIRLRDNMLTGNNQFLGGQGLAGIQASLSALQTSLADLGSRDERLTMTSKTLKEEIPQVVEMNSNLVDLDITDGVTRLKMLEQTHEASLRATAMIYPRTLMDFIK
ncbi:MAG: flagellar hook-associated protein 3 [Spirochaetales bacterium]|nr:flagellar hook-associated protein 3 [Spirochaetales bacterium]